MRQAKMLLALKLGLYMKTTGSIAFRIWKLMPSKTTDFLLQRYSNRLGNQIPKGVVQQSI